MIWGLLAGLLVLIAPATAQNPIVITLTADSWRADLYENSVIPAFEAEHPNIQVEFVYHEREYFGSGFFQAEEDLAAYYDDLAAYASSADVMAIGSWSFTPDMTNTGFFLDLTPLVNSDGDLNIDDFYPAAWQSFQWDGGIWALPTVVDLQVLVYDRNRFDAANLPYPDENWQVSDFVRTAEALQTFNEDGEVMLSPLSGTNPLLLMHGTLNPTYDDSTLPAAPDFSDPALIEQFTTYTDYLTAYDFAEMTGFMLSELGIYTGYPYDLLRNQSASEPDTDWAVAFLPGGASTITAQGHAVSSGTAHPEAAYELVSFMTRNIDLVYGGFSAETPARQSLEGARPVIEGTPPPVELPPEVQSVLDNALANAIPSSELRYSYGVFLASNLVQDEGLNPTDALQQAENQIQNVLDTAGNQRDVQITVAPPPFRREIATGEIALTFGLNAAGGPDARRDLWQDAIDTFAESHPTVADIDLTNQIYGQDGRDLTLDCWFDGFQPSLATRTAPPDQYLLLDPLLNADPDFNPNNFLPGILQEAQVQGGTYAYPVTVQPTVMWINREKFEAAGLPVPTNNWTANDLTNALTTFGSLRENPDEVILRDDSLSANNFLMLVAALGGLPVDYRTEPPTYNLTDPATVAALEQAVGFARQGLIQYSGYMNRDPGGFFNPSPDNVTMVMTTLQDGLYTRMSQDMPDSPLEIVALPGGTYQPVAYQLGMIYINPESPHIEACYDWMRTVSQRPELFGGLPADRTLLDDPAYIAQQGEDVITFYQSLVDRLTTPNRVQLPGLTGSVPSSTPGAWLEPHFLFHALDQAITEDADLVPLLNQADANLTQYRTCIDGIEILSVEEIRTRLEDDPDFSQAYSRQFVDCAVNILPELRQTYAFFYQD